MTSARQYQAITSYTRDNMSGHSLDWANQPNVHKVYADIEPVPLTRDIGLPEIMLSTLLKGKEAHHRLLESVSLLDLSRLLLMTYSFTAKARHSGEDFYFRSVASAGALYPSELYVGAHSVDGLQSGIYHFSITHHGLSLIRPGNLSEFIAMNTWPNSSHCPVLTFCLSAIFFRSAWKYRDRSYRYHLLDTGHLLEHLSLALKSLGYPFFISYDYRDSEINMMLGFDEKKEVAIAISQVPGSKLLQAKTPGKILSLPQKIKSASTVSEREIVYPAIWEIHSNGMGVPSQPPQLEKRMIDRLGFDIRSWTKIDSPSVWPEKMNFAESVFSRRSRRNFTRKSISHEKMSAVLEALCQTDFERESEPLRYFDSLCIGFLAGHIRGFEPGFYILDPASASFGMVKPGNFNRDMARICLDQAWLGNAAAHFLFMADLHSLDQLYGTRGYRYAMLTAGRLGERLYLTATALAYGCCGIGAFYDHEAVKLLGLREESRLLYLVAVGSVKSGIRD